MSRPRALALYVIVALTGVGSSVDAQTIEDLDAPIGWYVFDLSGVISPWGQPTDLAVSEGFDPSTQPSRGLGISAGGHVYPLRWKFITFGVGANVMYIAGSRSPGPDDPDPSAPSLRREMRAVSPQLSFNFGGRNGWSYISGGPGTSTITLYDPDAPRPASRSRRTFNYGGGARWFTRNHLALALDLRFYNAGPLIASDTEPASPRLSTLVLSIGASFK